jgi:hypothetical protein
MCWLNENTGAFQAICATLGIVGLAIYCWLTHGIRKSAVAQQKAAQAPMIMFFQGKNSWAIKNYGVGPASNIWWKPNAQNEKSSNWYHLGSLAAGDESDLPHHTRPTDAELRIMPLDGARIHYTDMASNNYFTCGIWRDEAFAQDWAEIKSKDRFELK